MPKFSKEKKEATIKTAFLSKINSQEDSENFKVSFQYLDTTQKYGSGFKDWQACGLLSKMMETLYGYSHKPLTQQYDGDKFSLYGGFPNKSQTLFSYPPSVPPDAHWARIHVTGQAVIVGHIVGNTFYYCCPLKVSEQRDIHPQCCCNGIADDFSEGKPLS